MILMVVCLIAEPVSFHFFVFKSESVMLRSSIFCYLLFYLVKKTDIFIQVNHAGGEAPQWE